MVARKKEETGEKYIHNITNDMFGLVKRLAPHLFSDGAHMLINGHTVQHEQNYVSEKRAVIVVGLLVYIFIST